MNALTAYPVGTPTIGATAPVIVTERVRLRPLRAEDFVPYAAFLASPRSVHMDGPHDIDTAWNWFCNDTAHWNLFGYGALMIEVDGKLAGQVSVTHGVQFPEPELGWFLFDSYEGKGFATEAATALRNHVYRNAGLRQLVSYCGSDNAASIAVAERLGAIYDPDAPRPNGDDCRVYRHPPREAII